MLRGFGKWLEEDPRGRFCVLNRRNYTRNGHDWNPMSDMELESLKGGSIFGRGVREKGGSGVYMHFVFVIAFGRRPIDSR